MSRSYQDENDELLRFLIDQLFFNDWRSDPSNHKRLGLTITGDGRLDCPIPESLGGAPDNTCVIRREIAGISPCFRNPPRPARIWPKCESCDLYKIGNVDDPPFQGNEESIKKNFLLLLENIEKNRFFIERIDLICGEIWHLDLGVELLDLLSDRLKEHRFTKTISIATNCTFMFHDRYKNKIQKAIDDLKLSEVDLHISCSVDGLLLEENSSSKLRDPGMTRDGHFYDELFEFARKNSCDFHPTIAARHIDQWIDNFDWWMRKLGEFDIPPERMTISEDRSDDWTGESIKGYKAFLEHVIQYKKDHHGLGSLREELVLSRDNNSIISLALMPDSYSCAIGDSLIVRLSDLSIVPCPRTGYEKFVYGKFEAADHEILRIRSKKVELANRIYCGDPKYMQEKCNRCKYRELCPGGCLGTQYEANGDLFIPCESVCALLRAKIDTLVKAVEKYCPPGEIPPEIGFYIHKVGE